MNIIVKLSLSACVLALVGCATGKHNYVQPSEYKHNSNTKTINKSFDTLWRDAVASLGKQFFVINNLDKSSGLINVSYSGSPEKYVDCGIHNSEVADIKGKRTYSINGASPYAEYETKDGLFITSITRKMSLEGRMNLLIQPISTNQTSATVNTKYIINRAASFRSTDGRFGSANDTISFNTGGSDAFPTGTTVCTSKGTLEQEVLNLIN